MTATTPHWVKDAVFYQIFPDRFARSSRVYKPDYLCDWGAPPTYHNFMGGDLLGIAEKLDYIADLGVNALYLNPIFISASNHRYHTNDYLQVDPLLGGNKAFAELLDEAHKRNIRVILDAVFNHAGRGFFQFNHLLECGRESPYLNWFHIYGWPVNAYNEHEPPNYAAWWGMHALPKFNTDTQAVRDYLWNVGTYWLEQGIDGWRLDVPNEIDDDEFWREFRRRCRAINPEAYIVGELWHEAHRWLQGDQFDGQMNYPFTRAVLGFFVGERLDQSEISNTGYGYISPLNAEQFSAELDRISNHLYDWDVVLAQMNMLGSHDTPRLSTLARHDKSAIRLMYLCQMTMPGAPNIYYGDEIGLPGHHDPDNRRAFPWHDETSWDNGLRNELKQFIQLRHETPALRYGTFEPLVAQDGAVVYMRRTAEQTVIVAFNARPKAIAIDIPWPDNAPQNFDPLLPAGATRVSAEGKTTLPKRDCRIWISR
ncbi:MAG: glycoside hydrolase family 13 protein [Anaerolineae bacterium]|nr:glycoside hydrolase family 13 protein [Anaerolineae bacterium]